MLLVQVSAWGCCLLPCPREALRFTAAFEPIPSRDVDRFAAPLEGAVDLGAARLMAVLSFVAPRPADEPLDAPPEVLFFEERGVPDAAPLALAPARAFVVVRGDLAMRDAPACAAVAVRTNGHAQRSCRAKQKARRITALGLERPRCPVIARREPPAPVKDAGSIAAPKRGPARL